MAAPKNRFTKTRKVQKEKRQSLLREVVGILLICLNAFMLLALFSFDREDPSFNNSGTGEAVLNLAGLAGSHLADLLLQLFGVATVWIPLMLALFSFRLLRKQPPPLFLDRVAALPAITLVTSLLAAFLVPVDGLDILPAGPGGVVGLLGGGAMAEAFGRWGSLLLLATLGLLALMILTRFSVVGFFHAVAAWRQTGDPPSLNPLPLMRGVAGKGAGAVALGAGAGLATVGFFGRLVGGLFSGLNKIPLPSLPSRRPKRETATASLSDEPTEPSAELDAPSPTRDERFEPLLDEESPGAAPAPGTEEESTAEIRQERAGLDSETSPEESQPSPPSPRDGQSTPESATTVSQTSSPSLPLETETSEPATAPQDPGATTEGEAYGANGVDAPTIGTAPPTAGRPGSETEGGAAEDALTRTGTDILDAATPETTPSALPERPAALPQEPEGDDGGGESQSATLEKLFGGPGHTDSFATSDPSTPSQAPLTAAHDGLGAEDGARTDRVPVGAHHGDPSASPIAPTQPASPLGHGGGESPPHASFEFDARQDAVEEEPSTESPTFHSGPGVPEGPESRAVSAAATDSGVNTVMGPANHGSPASSRPTDGFFESSFEWSDSSDPNIPPEMAPSAPTPSGKDDPALGADSALGAKEEGEADLVEPGETPSAESANPDFPDDSVSMPGTGDPNAAPAPSYGDSTASAPNANLEYALQEAREASQASPLDAAPEQAFALPPLSILHKPTVVGVAADRALLEEKSRLIEQKLADFKVKGQIIDAQPGPVVTTFELDPAPGLKAAKVIGIADDLARSISALSVRVVGNIPGRSVIGIEVPNERRQTVYLRTLLESETFQVQESPLAVALGSDINGSPVVADLAKMPHLLVAGTTGSGKSVAVNAMICSILFRSTPDEVRFLMVDPKMLELSIYEGIPHLLSPVVTDVKKAAFLFKWAVAEMEERYRLMSEMSVRNLAGFNARVERCLASGDAPTRRVKVGFDPETGLPVEKDEPIPLEKKPLVVIIVDELADLMMQVGKEVEPAIARLAQMARAAGIHLILATQRPSVDVLTGLIKANFPTRLAFQVSSRIDSRTILDAMGAERLLGMGDGLYQPPGTTHLNRIHAPFVADEEVHTLVATLKKSGAPLYDSHINLDSDAGGDGEEDGLAGAAPATLPGMPGLPPLPGMGDGGLPMGGGFGGSPGGDEAYDELYDQAVAVVVQARRVSTSMVQRHFKIGYNRAARIVERMELDGLVTEANSQGKREVIVPQRPE